MQGASSNITTSRFSSSQQTGEIVEAGAGAGLGARELGKNHAYGVEPFSGQILPIPAKGGHTTATKMNSTSASSMEGVRSLPLSLPQMIPITKPGPFNANEGDGGQQQQQMQQQGTVTISPSSSEKERHKIPQSLSGISDQQLDQAAVVEPIRAQARVEIKASKTTAIGELVLTPHFLLFDTKLLDISKENEDVEFCIDICDVIGCSAELLKRKTELRRRATTNNLASAADEQTEGDDFSSTTTLKIMSSPPSSKSGHEISSRSSALTSTTSIVDGTRNLWPGLSPKRDERKLGETISPKRDERKLNEPYVIEEKDRATKARSNTELDLSSFHPPAEPRKKAFLRVVWRNPTLGFPEPLTIRFLLSDIVLAERLVRVIHIHMLHCLERETTDFVGSFTYGEYLQQARETARPAEAPLLKADSGLSSSMGTMSSLESPPTTIEFSPNPSAILSRSAAISIAKNFPERLWNSKWCGISIEALFLKAGKSRRDESVMVIRTQNNGTFGVFATQPWVVWNNGFFGTGESFVFSVVSSKVDSVETVKVYRWTGKNTFFQTSSPSHIGVGGGGGGFAFALDEDLSHGTSNPCETYGNLKPLTSNGKSNFQVRDLELWTV